MCSRGHRCNFARDFVHYWTAPLIHVRYTPAGTGIRDIATTSKRLEPPESAFLKSVLVAYGGR